MTIGEIDQIQLQEDFQHLIKQEMTDLDADPMIPITYEQIN
jgi:hypothetical protein